MPFESKANGKRVTLSPEQHKLPQFTDMSSKSNVGSFPLKPSAAFRPSPEGWRGSK